MTSGSISHVGNLGLELISLKTSAKKLTEFLVEKIEGFSCENGHVVCLYNYLELARHVLCRSIKQNGET